MKRLAWTACLAFIAACNSTPRDDSDYFARALVGKWVEEGDDPACPSTGYLEYRADGSFTATHESCDITSDGFGIFRYGWYIADEHLCYVEIEEQYKDLVKRPDYYRKRFLEARKQGFVQDRCTERVGRVTARTITLVPRNSDVRPYTMKRGSW